MKKLQKLPSDFIKCKLPYGPIYARNLEHKDSFVERGLNKPGTLIFMEDGSTYLIGHINPMLGCCDDCTLFQKEAIVLGYKVLIQFND